MILKPDEKSYGKLYNVEYYMGNGRIATFSSILENIGDGYFYFKTKDGGLDIIEQRCIRTLTWCPNPIEK